MAKQTENSPCIDAGWGLVEEAGAGLSYRTTRTDSGFDVDEVDMGYHYPARVANIKCYLNASQYRAGALLDLSVRLANPDDQTTSADVYVAILMPTGQVFCLSDTGLAAGLHPFETDYEMIAGYLYGPTSLLQVQIPEGCPEGLYLAAAALFLPGSTTAISEMSFVDFVILP